MLETMSSTIFTCQGIGKGATCGTRATKRTASHKWNQASEEMEEIVVWLCEAHAIELQTAMANKRREITPTHRVNACEHEWSAWAYNHNGGPPHEHYYRSCKNCNMPQKLSGSDFLRAYGQAAVRKMENNAQAN